MVQAQKTKQGVLQVRHRKISPREKEVLHCLANGLTTAETAKKLFVSRETVKTHRSRLLLKMKARNAFQLGMIAVRLGLIHA